MKVCKRCFDEYDDEEDIYIDPTEDIEFILIQMGVDDINDLCPDCREELGSTICLGIVADPGYLTREDGGDF